ncbi:MAG: type II CRISPR-associated endonuclease Cas1 [Chitinophagales bacterium]
MKRTLFFSNPAYLSVKQQQLEISWPGDQHKPKKNIPIEDIGILVLEHSQITITNSVVQEITANKGIIIGCDNQHMPSSLMLPIEGHSELSKRYKEQINASIPLQKNLWKQLIEYKIHNQAALLDRQAINNKRLLHLKNKVTSGDTNNCEAQAAVYYWDNIFDLPFFTRDRYGEPPNNLLNYGYAILRAITARALVASGLLTALGIFHRNKYNAYCLADDVMEPYRPFVDQIVIDIMEEEGLEEFLSPATKQKLLKICTEDVLMSKKSSPLLVAISRTTNSLQQCYEGSQRRLKLPKLSMDARSV